MIALLRKIVGWSLICLGIIGLFLPILQGVLLILVGLAFLGERKHFEWIKRKIKHKR